MYANDLKPFRKVLTVRDSFKLQCNVDSLSACTVRPKSTFMVIEKKKLQIEKKITIS